MQKSARNLQAAFHPAGKCLHTGIPPVPQLEQFEEHLNSLHADSPRDVVEHSVQIHVLVSGQLVIETGILEDDAKPAACIEWIGRGIDAIECYRGRAKISGLWLPEISPRP